MIHISSSELSPRFPRYPLISAGNSSNAEQGYQTTFTLVLEPLIFGFLPQTAVSALLWIVIFASGAAWAVPYIRRRIADLVDGSAESGGDRLKSS